MGFSPVLTEEGYEFSEDHRWLRSAFGFTTARPVTLDGPAFAAVFPEGIVPSGVLLSKDEGTGKYFPYGTDLTDEVQTVTIDATGGTFTLTFDGDTTDDLAYDIAATDLEAALEGLDSIGEGNVAVSGAAGGPYTVSFIGDLANANVDSMVADDDGLTGGAGTAVVATGTAGGAADTVEPEGLLMTTQSIMRGTHTRVVTDVTAPLIWHCEVVTEFLPENSGFDEDARTALTHISFT